MPARPSAPSRRRLLALAGRSAALAVLTPMLAGRRAAADAPQTLRIGGTGTALGSMRLIAEAFMQRRPGTEIVVLPSLGTGGGIKALLAGAIGVALSGRALKDEEQAKGAADREYARTPFVFAVRRDNKLAEISSEQLVRIYAGEITAWPDGLPLRLVMRPATEADILILRRLSPAMDQAVLGAMRRQGLLIAATDQENADMLERLPGSFGATTLGLILAERRALKPLALDGVVPTPAAVASGAYPLFKPLHLVTALRSAPLAAEFVAFVGSAEGQAILASVGHLPLGTSRS